MSRFFNHVDAGILPAIMLVCFVGAFIGYALWVYWPSRKQQWNERAQLPLQEDQQRGV